MRWIANLFLALMKFADIPLITAGFWLVLSEDEVRPWPCCNG